MSKRIDLKHSRSRLEGANYYRGVLTTANLTPLGHLRVAIKDCQKLTDIPGTTSAVLSKTPFEPGLFLIPKRRERIHSDMLELAKEVENNESSGLIQIKTLVEPRSGKVVVAEFERLATC